MRIRTMMLILLTLGMGLVFSGCPCGEEAVTLTPLSGPFGYHFEGPYDLQGNLTKDNLEDAEWELNGKFVFPTGGYSAAQPEVTVAESYPEQVTIVLRVREPLPGTPVTQVVMEVPVAAAISASNEAMFSMKVVRICYGWL